MIISNFLSKIKNCCFSDQKEQCASNSKLHTRVEYLNRKIREAQELEIQEHLQDFNQKLKFVGQAYKCDFRYSILNNGTLLNDDKSNGELRYVDKEFTIIDPKTKIVKKIEMPKDNGIYTIMKYEDQLIVYKRCTCEAVDWSL